MVNPNSAYPELVEGLHFSWESGATLRQAQGSGLGLLTLKTR